MIDWLNDPLTHIERCGPILRSTSNNKLTPLANLIPKHFFGVPVEYDLTYESPKNTISGYRFTDLLTSCLALLPCNTPLALDVITKSLNKGPTDIGYYVLNKVRNDFQDKYELHDSHANPSAVVVLPGSNVICRDAVNWDVVSKAVSSGAFVKPHPITTKIDLRNIGRRYPGHVLDANSSLYSMLKTATDVYFPDTSETGFVSYVLDKNVISISQNYQKNIGTFYAYYEALNRCNLNMKMSDKVAALFSHPETGLFSIYHSDRTDMEQWVNAFFYTYQIFDHGRNGSFNKRRL